MKNLLLLTAKSFMVLAVVLMVSPIRAQMSSFADKSGKDNTPAFTVTIPDQWKESIIREDNDQVSTFSLSNGNTAPVFLFSVTQIPEQQWVKTKAQLTDAKMLAHKDGFVYFSQKNSKEKIKGPSSELYAQIHSSLDQLISSIEVN